MQAHAGDAGVFIRSMATRGHLGGLARATGEAALVLDASGKDIVVIETVGVGQDEVDIVRTADIAVVTLVPGTGDDVQAMKAGLMEIADIFVVNKADRDGADRTAASVEAMLSLEGPAGARWRPQILKTEATRGIGVDALVDGIDRFRAAHADTQGQRRRARAEGRVRELLSDRFVAYVLDRVLQPGELNRLLDSIAARERDPYSVVDDLVRRALREGDGSPAVDHVGIAVSDVDAAIAFYRDALGLEVEPAEEVATDRVRAHFIPAGSAALELLEGTAPDSPITKYLARRGPGIHHLTLRVPDIRNALARLKAHGVRLIDEEPRDGAHGSLVAFVHPSSAHGVLVELKESRNR
jgi:LAO/AO transport system kinase